MVSLTGARERAQPRRCNRSFSCASFLYVCMYVDMLWLFGHPAYILCQIGKLLFLGTTDMRSRTHSHTRAVAAGRKYSRCRQSCVK